MKKALIFLPLLSLCGCLSPAPEPSVSYWLLEFRGASAVAASPRYGVARLSQVIVNLPYAGDRLVVLKKDGSVAFDAHNVFAASPSAQVRDLCLSAMGDSGLFADVVGSTSGASAEVDLEVVVRRLAIDCRQEDPRKAVVGVFVRMLKGRSIVGTAEGDGSADASDGDYGVAFSKALSSAVSSALSKLR